MLVSVSHFLLKGVSGLLGGFPVCPVSVGCSHLQSALSLLSFPGKSPMGRINGQVASLVVQNKSPLLIFIRQHNVSEDKDLPVAG